MAALFSELGLPSLDWCCLDGSRVAPAKFEVAANQSAVRWSVDATAVKPFYQFCAECHQTLESSPPGFLYGDLDQVTAKLAHCAERVYFRLRMWQFRPDDRPKTPMPPAYAIHAFNLGAQQWRDSLELKSLTRYVRDVLESRSETEQLPEELLTRGYNNLQTCLPEVQ